MNVDVRMKFRWETFTVVLLDMLAILCAGGFALMVRYEFSYSRIPAQYVSCWLRSLPTQMILTAVVFALRRMYSYVWRSVSARDVIQMAFSVAIAYVVSETACLLYGAVLPRSVMAVSFLCQMILLVGMRCALRFYTALSQTFVSAKNHGERIMLVGAGATGQTLQREIESSEKIRGKLCCFVDDDERLWGKVLGGVPISGGRDSIPELVKKENISQIILAIPSVSARDKRAILEICKETGCKVRSLPGIYQMVNGEAKLSAVRDVQVEDLLGREPVKLDIRNLNECLGGKTVLVTGGGGSIGSELCRQIAKFHPGRMVVVDIYENNAYDIQQELTHAYGDRLDLRVEIASVRDKAKIEELFARYHPDIVFHAAAHKHVPLMEACPEEAIKNNIFGTYHVIRAAEKFGVRKFVMISTDKAVNPTNFMGATKRFCEMILQSRPESATEFCAVRFGNVLGSNGSVVPLFKKQIEAGGPITITDKRIIRYFMTIPEAAQLVLEAGAMAGKNQIYVLDMGEPVKIQTLAENMIRLAGLEPYKDIDIKEIGLRPGEKLYEELLMKSENLSKTANEKIFIEQQRKIPQKAIMEDLERLDRAISEEKLSGPDLIALLREIVPTYNDPDMVNQRAAALESQGEADTKVSEPDDFEISREGTKRQLIAESA